MPTLITVGELDLPDFHLIAERLERELPDARRVTIPGAGHAPSLEAPEAFEQLLEGFLEA